MKINKLKVQLILTLAIVAMSVSSCKKAIDLYPSDSFSDANAFQNMEDIQRGVNTCYGRMGAYANDLYVSALLSDEGKLGVDNSGQGALTYRYQFNSDGTTGGDVTAAWGAYYSIVNQATIVLSKIDAIDGDAARKTELKGQLRALRAIAHFYLLQAYADNYDAAKLGIPNRTVYNVTDKPKRNTIGENVKFIEDELAAAKSLLSTSTIFSDTTINYLNLTAYQAKLAQYKGDYDAVITYCNTLLGSSGLPLATKTPATIANFPKIWTDDLTHELLFRIRYTGGTIGNLWTTTTGDVYIAPSDKLFATYATADVRKNTFIGTLTGGKRFLKKYEKSTSRGGRVVDLKVMRISEIYLMRAEAYAKSTSPNLSAGTDDLNTLRKQRITGYVNVPAFSTSSDLVTAVVDERFKELCFEGIRFFDLKRNKLPVQRLPSDAGSSWQTLATGNYRFVLPITADEMLANPNMIQNPGY